MPRGIPAKKAVETKNCLVILENLWTSEGKHIRKDVVRLPADEADKLEADDKVMIIPGGNPDA